MNRVFRFFLLAVLLVCGLSNPLWAKTIALPLTIDYQLLRSLVIQNAFTDPGASAILEDDEHGCWEIRITDPIFAEEDGRLRFQTRVYVSAGVPAFGNCILPVEWDGYLVLYQKPRVDKRWILSFDMVDSSVYDRDFNSATIASLIWNLVKTSVYHYLSSITINLAPPISDLKHFIRPLFPQAIKPRADRLIGSLRPGEARTQMDALRIDVLGDIKDTDESTKERRIEALSESELTRLVARWEAWDAYLIHIITSLSREPLTDDDRNILLDVLLETRYRFIAGLNDQALKKEFVREQFLSSWKDLSRVFRNHLGDDPSRDLLGYLAFFTASDALAALDKIGPTLGIEISRDGLVRLSRMILDKEEDMLAYTADVNEDLRRMLGLGIPIAAPGESYPGEEIEWNPGKETSYFNFLMSTAWAAKTDSSQQSRVLSEIEDWLFKDKRDIRPYIGKIQTLLGGIVDDRLGTGIFPDAFHDRYRDIVFATAWQESCFRQFAVKKRKITYLRSYNKTSVGMMQINERIWRGIYDRNHLRWDIRYNSRAGCEILTLYIKKYAYARLKKYFPGQILDDRTFAGLVYAMYNGGPGQLKKYLSRRNKDDYYKSDRLFAEKYDWVHDAAWDNIRKCLVGR